MMNNTMMMNNMNNPMMMNNMMMNNMNNQMMMNNMNNPMMMNNMMMNNMNYPMMMNNMMMNNMNYPMMMNNMNNMNYPMMMNNMNNMPVMNQIRPTIYNNNVDNTLNSPLNGATIISENQRTNCKYFQYPLDITFTNEEEKKSKVILVIGQTGSGKTSFINALVNIYSGITIYDNFRYLINSSILSDGPDSQTKEIAIYNIKPREGLNYPPIKIIDTPGFGDTGGDKEDENHFKEFKKCFNDKIPVINCIFYIAKATDVRWGDKENKIFNCLMELFGEDVNRNFVIGVTNFYPSSEYEEPSFISIFKNSCVREDNRKAQESFSFYYDKILKRKNMTKDEIFQTYWYFASDNKIIFNYNIKRNEREKEKWNYTENEIKNLIELKIKQLKAVPILKSKEVLNLRDQIKVENECLFNKLEILKQLKEVYEFNKTEIEILKERIEEQSNIIKKHKEEKKKINKDIKKNKEELKLKLKPYQKKIIKKRKIYSENQNILCECENNDLNNWNFDSCPKVCHKNCDCIFSSTIHKWFCHIFDWEGNCKNCGHSISTHVKENNTYEQYEKIEIIDRINALKIIDEYKIVKKDNEDYIIMINNVEDNINNLINHLKNEKIIYENKNNKYEEDLLLVEIEGIKILNKINENLIILKEKALLKKNTELDEYVNNFIKNEKSEKKQQFIQESLKKYKILEKEKININNDELLIQEYKKLKQKKII